MACSSTGDNLQGKEQAKVETAPKEEVAKTVTKTEKAPEAKVVVAKPKVKPKQAKPQLKAEAKPKAKPKPKPLTTKSSDGKLILGSEEWVYIPSLDQNFKAKVDTGAALSSISADNVIHFEREGKPWVKFKVEHGELSSEEVSLPVLRWVKIKQANSKKPQRRPVVTTWVQLGEYKEKADFTLTDRKHLKSPIILGQRFFRDVAIVDVSRKYVQPKKK